MNDEPALYAPDDYFARIERQFGLRRGGPLVLSPRDWQRVERWEAKGIPLVAVLQGINRAFDYVEATPGTARVNSLAYCEQHVLDAWEQARELAATSGSSARDDPTVAHLLLCADACRRSACGTHAGALEAAATALEGLAATADELSAEALDERAEALQRELARELERLGSRVPLPPFSPWGV
jgi:hypothetical protein